VLYGLLPASCVAGVVECNDTGFSTDNSIVVGGIILIVVLVIVGVLLSSRRS
jgi:hypothetical protein